MPTDVKVTGLSAAAVIWFDLTTLFEQGNPIDSKVFLNKRSPVRRTRLAFQSHETERKQSELETQNLSM